jgi:flagellar protein FlaF
VSQQKNVNAYKNHQQVELDGREIDKRALLNCASKLKIALDDGGKDMKLYQEAIRHNQHLWTLFQVALTEPSNPLSQDLKLTLLRLSGYIDRVSFRAITEFLPDMINSLIDINRTIAVGLAKKPQQGQAQTQNPVAQGAPYAGAPVSVSTSA